MIDARGLSCPLPVVMTQDAVKKEHPDTLEVLVDNACAMENVTRFAMNSGYEVSAQEKDEEYLLTLKKK